MTPRRTFALGAALGAGFVVGVLVDAALDVTDRVACWAAPVERAVWRGADGQPGEVDPPDVPAGWVWPPRVGPGTGALPDLAGEP